MINLLYEELPNSIEVEGSSFSLYTDFRGWIELNDALLTNDSEYIYISLMAVFKDTPSTITKDVINAIIGFLNGNTDHAKTENEPRTTEKSNNKRIFDFKQDADYFISSFLESYNIDLIDVDYMHWWKFLSLFNGLKEDTPIKQRMSYRSIELSSIKDKNERKRISKIQKAIALKTNKKVLTDEEIANAF